MPDILDLNRYKDKRVSTKSGLMFNKFQRAFIGQYEIKEQEEYYKCLDDGKLGKLPQDIPAHLH